MPVKVRLPGTPSNSRGPRGSGVSVPGLWITDGLAGSAHTCPVDCRGITGRGSRQEGDTLSWQLQPLQSPGQSPSGQVGCGTAGHQHQDPSSVGCFQLYNMPVSDTWAGEEIAHELGNILSRIAERVRH